METSCEVEELILNLNRDSECRLFRNCSNSGTKKDQSQVHAQSFTKEPLLRTMPTHFPLRERTFYNRAATRHSSQCRAELCVCASLCWCWCRCWNFRMWLRLAFGWHLRVNQTQLLFFVERVCAVSNLGRTPPILFKPKKCVKLARLPSLPTLQLSEP